MTRRNPCTSLSVGVLSSPPYNLLIFSVSIPIQNFIAATATSGGALICYFTGATCSINPLDGTIYNAEVGPGSSNPQNILDSSGNKLHLRSCLARHRQRSYTTRERPQLPGTVHGGIHRYLETSKSVRACCTR
ncbi:hypothetical protein CALVIDRAFT_371062 [Calocera viscosa TUFC12733]|uniref:Uncharacterized protein n=1 Tax=Calocera viscosa (strain TUFC12733) TaxID=1330018 RepID=A0A167GVQ6_CALVF|nr:hypothetical protein CALVIDRAFT_371062 [Calocera viscosa TUFC12733]